MPCSLPAAQMQAVFGRCYQHFIRMYAITPPVSVRSSLYPPKRQSRKHCLCNACLWWQRCSECGCLEMSCCENSTSGTARLWILISHCYGSQVTPREAGFYSSQALGVIRAWKPAAVLFLKFRNLIAPANQKIRSNFKLSHIVVTYMKCVAPAVFTSNQMQQHQELFPWQIIL